MAVAAFSEAKWYPDTPSEIYNLSHLTCPPNWGKSKCLLLPLRIPSWAFSLQG